MYQLLIYNRLLILQQNKIFFSSPLPFRLSIPHSSIAQTNESQLSTDRFTLHFILSHEFFVSHLSFGMAEEGWTQFANVDFQWRGGDHGWLVLEWRVRWA